MLRSPRTAWLLSLTLLTSLAGCASNAPAVPLIEGNGAFEKAGVPAASTPTMYLSDAGGGDVYAYDERGFNLRRQFGPFSSPSGIATDATGNVYVTDWGQGSYDGHVYVVAHRGKKPFLTLDDVGALPSDVAVAANGTVYVANGYDEHGCGSGGDVRVYAKGASSSSYTICDSVLGSPYSQVNGVGLDSKDDVFVTWENAAHTQGRVREFVAGSSSNGYFVGGVVAWPYGVQIDSRDRIVVASATSNAVYVYSRSGRKIQRTFSNIADPLFIAFDASQHHLFVAAAASNQVDEIEYSTGSLVRSLNFPGQQLNGIAIVR